MTTSRRLSLGTSLATLLFLGGAQVCAAEYLFSDGFEQEVSGQPNPIWSWKKPYTPENPFGMMIGGGDIYERSQANAFRGRYSLRLNFDGRNGFCNTCGAYPGTVTDISEGRVRIVPKETLLKDSGVTTRSIFDRADHWARWQALLDSTGVIEPEGDAPIRNELQGRGLFSKGDEIRIARVCGIDGNVGKKVDRRSDCDLAINYLEGVSPADFPLGGTLARRFYFLIPSATTLPDNTLKLAYSTFERRGRRYSIYPALSVQRGETLEVGTAPLTGAYSITGRAISRDTWYYFEEVYTRESAEDAADGEYEVYFAPAEETSPAPVISAGHLTFGALQAMSIVGNWQHSNDAMGYMFLDEVAVASRRLGPEGPP